MVPAACARGLACLAFAMVSLPVRLCFSLCAALELTPLFLALRDGPPPEPCEGAPSEPRPARGLRSSQVKSSPEVPLPPQPPLDTYVVPAVPTHGTSFVPVSVLLAWRSEVVAAQTEYLHADAAHAAAVAAKKAADAAARTAAANVRVAAARRGEAGKRSKHAWSTYTGLVGDVSADALGPSGGSFSRPVGVRGGKGKAPASSRSSAEEDEVVDLAEFESGSEDEEEDAMVE